MKIVLLAGGLGTRLQEETGVKPKPMVEVGGRPLLWHIMKGYAARGFREFVVALGYKGEVIKRFFLELPRLGRDLMVSLRDGAVTARDGPFEDWTVHLADTGLSTHTGGRLLRLRPWIGGEPFGMTYGDGVSDQDLAALVAFHRSHGRLATVTAVRPPARFGALVLEKDRVRAFAEKPLGGEGWINGGFFVLEPKVLDFISGDDVAFEGAPLERLARDGQLMAFRHEGFWRCVDTLRDLAALEALWSAGKAPWKTWT